MATNGALTQLVAALHQPANAHETRCVLESNSFDVAVKFWRAGGVLFRSAHEPKWPRPPSTLSGARGQWHSAGTHADMLWGTCSGIHGPRRLPQCGRAVAGGYAADHYICFAPSEHRNGSLSCCPSLAEMAKQCRRSRQRSTRHASPSPPDRWIRVIVVSWRTPSAQSSMAVYMCIFNLHKLSNRGQPRISAPLVVNPLQIYRRDGIHLCTTCHGFPHASSPAFAAL